MKKNKILKFSLVVVILLGVIGGINVYSKSLVEHYDDMFKTNEFTVYTDGQITDDYTLYQSVYDVVRHYNIQEYWNSSDDYSYLKLGVQNCNYEKMTCDFKLDRDKYVDYSWSSELVKEYYDIKVSVESDIDDYFYMVEDDKITINYDESMFASEMEKSDYIIQYFNGLSIYKDGISTNYSYDAGSKIVSRIEYADNMITSVMNRKIDDVVFEYAEGEFSDEFKKLTSGTLVIKSDTEINLELLSNYLSSFWITSGSFSVDGDIVNNKVFIKRMEYHEGSPTTVAEKHLITLVQDSNVDTNLFEKIGVDTAYNIPAEKPTSSAYEYLNTYFNYTNYNFNLDDGYERYEELFTWGQSDYVIVKYYQSNSDNENSNIQYHKVPVRFVGYSDVISDTYKKKVGEDEVVISADRLDLQTINSHFDYNPSALGCNEDFSYCDIGYYDYQTNIFEIHKMKMVLNNVVTDAFKTAFNIKEDGTIDIVVGKDVYVSHFAPYFYDERTYDSLEYQCDNFNFSAENKKCKLTLKNYIKNIAESHDVEYRVIESSRSSAFQSRINSSINVYPGESNYLWGSLSSEYEYFSKTKDNKITIGQCSSIDKTCPVMIINSDKILEVHNTKINVLEGKSPEFSKLFKGDTIKLNSIYKDDIDYLYRASMAYLMSKTKSWSYLSDFADNKGKIVYNNIEAHTMNVEFAKVNEEHKKVVDDIVDRLGNESIDIFIDDLEFINDFYYREEDVDFVASNYNSKMLNDVLGKLIDNKHISYFLSVEGGLGGQFMQLWGGQVVLYYDGIAYATTNAFVETIFRNIVYIPDDTENTREAYIAAAQKRVNDYLGKNNGVVVSYSRVLDEDEIDSEFIDTTGMDGNVYRLSYKNKTTEFLIAKDSSKMKTSTFNAVDVNNNVSISSDNANYPTNTVVSSDKIENNKEMLKRLGLDDAEVIDINLYSPTIGDINNFNNVEFDVNVPIDTTKFDSDKLYAYYIDNNGEVEEHPVVLDDFMATFNTNHFSTYIIAEKVPDNILNPNTSDKVMLYVLLGCLSIITLGFGVYLLKKKNFS